MLQEYLQGAVYILFSIIAQLWATQCNVPRWLFNISYPMCDHGIIIVKYICPQKSVVNIATAETQTA